MGGRISVYSPGVVHMKLGPPQVLLGCSFSAVWQFFESPQSASAVGVQPAPNIVARQDPALSAEGADSTQQLLSMGYQQRLPGLRVGDRLWE